MNAAVDDMHETSRVLHEEPMSKHTSWRVGGPAELYFKPTSVAQLQDFLAAPAGECSAALGRAWARICWCGTVGCAAR